MRWGALAIAILTTACVPTLEYQGLKKQLNTVRQERDAARVESAVCADQNKKLRESLKDAQKIKPTKIDMDPKRLEEIKRKAFEESDRKFKSGINRGNMDNRK